MIFLVAYLKSHEAKDEAVSSEQWKQVWCAWEKLQGIGVMPAIVLCARRLGDGNDVLLAS